MINKHPIKVTHFQRKSILGCYSLERMFSDVRAAMPVDVVVRESSFVSRGLWRRVGNIIEAAFRQSDVNHVTGEVHFLTYLLSRRRTVLTILDCVMLERLHGIKHWLLWLLWYWLPEKRCVAITVISEATRQQVLRYLRCDPNKVHVIYCNVSEEFKPLPQPFNVSKPRLLQIGTTDNKNLPRLAAALEGLGCELVIVGRLSSEQIDVLQQHRVSYENLLGLSREALVEQYQRCDMVVFASTYEGFGLPIVEANAVARPVVTSNLWSMPEVAGDAACLVDPFDIDSIRAGITRVIEDSNYREQLVKNGLENVKRFQIGTIAEQYAALYKSVYAGLTHVSENTA